MVELDTKQRLIEEAKRLFARKGYDGVSVKEICDAAGANVSLISYHFDGKEGLYRACLEQYGNERISIAERFLQPAKTRDEMRLRMQVFLEEFFRAHLNEPDLSRIVQREIVLESDFAHEHFQRVFLTAFASVCRFMEAGQTEGFVRKDLDVKLLASIFMGSCGHMCQMDGARKKHFKVSLEDADFRRASIETFVRVFMDGALTPTGGK